MLCPGQPDCGPRNQGPLPWWAQDKGSCRPDAVREVSLVGTQAAWCPVVREEAGEPLTHPAPSGWGHHLSEAWPIPEVSSIPALRG